ncbi:MAG: hypothetical protein C4576_20620 [Desulfobacteraceae bacterium]|nr:MAG: hypothetical protein C4576_20620 [Desulfobacteraceae bacterium]
MKMESKAPSGKEWITLYSAAKVFEKTRPWEWMEDTDLFGVENPEDGEIGYCCIMGAAGEVFGVSAYLGSEGLLTYRNMASGEIGIGSEDLLYIQKALSATFVGKRELEKEDLEIIGRLGLKLRGRNGWPQFRSYLPGYVPWHLTGAQARFLTSVLEQAVLVAGRLLDNPDLLLEKGEDLVLVRIFDKRKKAAGWKDSWIAPEPWERPEILSGPLDEIRLHRIRKQVKKGKSVWEIDSFHYPGAIAEQGRPYFPCLSLILDRESEIVMGSWLKAPWERYDGFQQEVIMHLENSGDLPKTIRVRKEEIFELLAPIADTLKIGLKQVESLEGIGQIRATIAQ